MKTVAFGCVALVCAAAANAQTFEVASVKPANPALRVMRCSGGPATSDPGTWRCSGVPLAFVIAQAYGFPPWQFSPHDPCCNGRFDFEAKVPAGTSKEQFHQMMQNLLAERFKLKLRREQAEMPVYELTVAEGGAKLKAAREAIEPDPWAFPRYTIGKDGCPVFAQGSGGVAGANGCYRWVASGVPMAELLKTLAFYLGRPVIDATGLRGAYDIDLTWSIDINWIMESAGLKDQVPDVPSHHGPTLQRALQDQLGLKVTSKKGMGERVSVEHVEKVPVEN